MPPPPHITLLRSPPMAAKSCILLFALISSTACSNAMARTPLTPAERATLSNLTEFNQSLGASGWHFQSRVVSDLDLSGIALRGAVITDVEFENVKLDRATVVGCQF